MRERAGMRGEYNQSVSFLNSLTPTLSQRERGLLQHPPGERVCFLRNLVKSST